MNLSAQAARRATHAQLLSVSDAPGREADWLLEHVTGLNRQQLRGNRLLTAEQHHRLSLLTARRARGEPLAYVLGEQYFWTLRLNVSPAVLIPRPETELVVERALQHLDQRPTRVLELGTGSGAIALAVASERPHAQVWAVDQSEPALAIARDNAHLNAVGNVTFLHSDWYAAVPRQAYDLILGNPPYIAVGDPHLEAAVLAHEPHAALISGSDGLTALRAIIEQAPDFLAPGAWLVLEHGWQQAQPVRQLLESAGLTSVASHADLAGHPRVMEARAPGRSSLNQ